MREENEIKTKIIKKENGEKIPKKLKIKI